MRFVVDASRDLRHAIRVLFASPTVTVVAITALAVGIGVNITIFGFVNATLLHPLAATEPDRLIRASLDGPNDIERQVSYPEYRVYRDANQTLSSVALFHWGGIVPVRMQQQPAEPIHIMPVTGNYFLTLGVNATLGRTFTEADDRPGGAGRVVVLSDEGWRLHFNADPNVIGQTVFILGVPHTVIGVLPAPFTGTVWPVIPRMYVTWAEHAPPVSVARGGLMIGRLRPGVDVMAARADAARMASQIAPGSQRPFGLDVTSGETAIRSDNGTLLAASLLLLVVGAVLWVACGNVAILQLARTVARRREMAIRLALGATRTQLLRQLLIETLLLALVSGVGAVILALAAAQWLTQLRAPVPMPLALVFYFDWRVAAFAFGLTIAAALLTGLGAALDSRRTDVTGVLLHESSELARSRVRRGLIVGQVAMSTVLLAIATSLGLSVITPLPRGMDTDRVLMGTLTLSPLKYPGDTSRVFFEQVLTEIERAPGIVSATVVDTIPLANNRPLSTVDVTAADDSPTSRGVARVLVNDVSRGHFQTLGIPLIAGRDFNADDVPESLRVAIVNQTFARRYWSDGVAVGRRVRIGSDEWVTVVGVAHDSKYQSFDEAPKPFIYRPLGQATRARVEGTLLIKTSGEPMLSAPMVRARVGDLDRDLAVFNLNAFESRVSLAMLPNRTAASLSGLLGVIALGLGTIGTYSIMAFLTLQRRREIGIRIALGALPSAVVAMIARQGLRSVASGLVIGAGLSIGALRFLQGTMYGVSAANPLPVLLVIAVIGASGHLACAIPTRRAANGDPVRALRE